MSEVAALHGIPVRDIVAANPHKPLQMLGSGEVVFAELSDGEDIRLPGTVGFSSKLVIDPGGAGAGRKEPGQASSACPPDQLFVSPTTGRTICVNNSFGAAYGQSFFNLYHS